MSYEKRITGVSHGFSMEYMHRRSLEDAKSEELDKKKLLDEEKEKLLLYLELLEI